MSHGRPCRLTANVPGGCVSVTSSPPLVTEAPAPTPGIPAPPYAPALELLTRELAAGVARPRFVSFSLPAPAPGDPAADRALSSAVDRLLGGSLLRDGALVLFGSPPTGPDLAALLERSEPHATQLPLWIALGASGARQSLTSARLRPAGPADLHMVLQSLIRGGFPSARPFGGVGPQSFAQLHGRALHLPHTPAAECSDIGLPAAACRCGWLPETCRGLRSIGTVAGSADDDAAVAKRTLVEALLSHPAAAGWARITAEDLAVVSCPEAAVVFDSRDEHRAPFEVVLQHRPTRGVIRATGHYEASPPPSPPPPSGHR